MLGVRCWGVVAGAVMFLAAPTSAQARPAPMPGSGDVGHRARISFELDAVYWQATLLTPSTEGELWLRDHTVGVFGYRRIPGAIGAAFAMNEWVALGARVNWAFEPSARDTLTIRGGFSPFVQVFVGRDRHVRPFLQLRGGVGRSHTFSSRADEGLRTVGPRTWYPTVGGGVGAHVFITEAVSFDAAASLDYRWNLVRPLAGAPEVTPAKTASWTFSDATVGTSLALGFSHWF